MKVLVVVALLALGSVCADVRDAIFNFRTLQGKPQVGSSANLDSLISLRAQQLDQLQAVKVQQVQPQQVIQRVQTIQTQPQFIQRFQVQQQQLQPVQIIQQQPQIIQQQVQQVQQVQQPQNLRVNFETVPFEPAIRILKHAQEVDPIGNYRYSFLTSNGISVDEEGKVIQPGTQEETIAKQGSYSYTGDDGQQYSLSWIADEDGFRASGDHLPTPPPIPAEIQRSLELNAQDPTQYDEQGFPLK